MCFLSGLGYPCRGLAGLLWQGPLPGLDQARGAGEADGDILTGPRRAFLFSSPSAQKECFCQNFCCPSCCFTEIWNCLWAKATTEETRKEQTKNDKLPTTVSRQCGSRACSSSHTPFTSLQAPDSLLSSFFWSWSQLGIEGREGFPPLGPLCHALPLA